MRTGFPVMKTGFSLLGIGLQGVPCKMYRAGFAVYEAVYIYTERLLIKDETVCVVLRIEFITK